MNMYLEFHAWLRSFAARRLSRGVAGRRVRRAATMGVLAASLLVGAEG